MKFLIVGDGHSTIHERAYCNALKKLGHEVHLFAWYEYFNRFQYSNTPKLKKYYMKFQNKFILGSIIRQINYDLLKIANSIKPDVIFIYHGTHIWKGTILSLKNKRILIVGYNNDDPFSPKAPYLLWRHYLRCIPYFDINFVYRPHNIEDYLKAGAKNAYLLRSYYIPEKNYPIELIGEDIKAYGCDVVFIGHYEDDGRKEYLEEIVKEGFKLKLFGTEWNRIIKRSKYLAHFYPVRAVRDEEYNKAICGAKIVLCFLSKLNRDTYTRRCFEIFAARQFMLSEYSDDLSTLFVEGGEAEYFRDRNELINKIRFYLKNDEKRLSIAQKGFEKVILGRHDVVSRMEYVTEIINKHITK